MLPIAFHTFLVLWLAFLGGTVGSFLNVVVYRLPLGLSLVHPPSRCPNCLHEIRWFDNIPVLGWLWLRGKCRDCSEPISARYPLVEALTAGLFLLVAWVDNMFPLWAESFVSVHGRWEPTALLIGSAEYLIHMVLVCTVWTAGLMQRDGKLPPARMLLVMGILIALGTMAWIMLLTSNTVPAGQMSPNLSVVKTDSPWHGVAPLMSLFSGVASAMFAMLATYFWTHIDYERSNGRWTFVELAAICGLVIPAYSMLVVIACAVMFGWVAVLFNRRSNYPLLCLVGGLLIGWCLGDRPLAMLGWLFLSLHYNYWVYQLWFFFVCFTLLLILLTEVCVMIRRRALPPGEPPVTEGEFTHQGG